MFLDIWPLVTSTLTLSLLLSATNALARPCLRRRGGLHHQRRSRRDLEC